MHKDPHRPRVVIPLAHTRAAFGAVRSLGRAGYEVVAALPPMGYRPPTMRSRWVARVIECPNPYAQMAEFRAWLRRHLDAHTSDVVLPADEAVIAAAAPVRDAMPDGARIILPSTEHLAFSLSKFIATQAAMRAGVAVPRTAFLRSPEGGAISRDLGGLPFPFILKWDNFEEDGRYTKGSAIRIADETTFLDVIAELEPSPCAVIAQEIVPGRGAGAFLLRDDGKVILRFAHERVHEVPWPGGVSSMCRATGDRDVLRAGETLLEAIDYGGVAMVEFRRVPGRPPVFLEINGRMWGSIGLALRAGVDFPLALLETHLYGRTTVEQPTLGRTLRWRNLPLELEHIRSVFRSRKQGDRTAPSRIRSLASFAWHSFDPRTKSDLLWWDDPRPGLTAIRGELVAQARRLKASLVGLASSRQTAARRDELVRQSLRIVEGFAVNPPNDILFLCYGNICRSPYAEARWNAIRRVTPHLPPASSAGFHPREQRMTPRRFQSAARRRGIDLACHRSRLVTADMLAKAGVIVIMDMANAKSLRSVAPGATVRTILLRALVDGDSPDIPDPYAKPLPDGAHAYAMIDEALTRMYEMFEGADKPPPT